MKALRAAAVALAILLALSLAGCYDETYFFSFADEQTLTDTFGNWTIGGAGTDGLNDFGLYLNDRYTNASFALLGDFTITANFWLGVNAEKPGSLMIMLSDPAYAGTKSGSWMEIKMEGLGTEVEVLSAEDGLGAEVEPHLNEVGLIGGINRGHWNVLSLVKKGNNIILRVNSKTLANFDMVNYASSSFILTLFSTSDPAQDPTDPKLGFILKDVTAEYDEGNAQPLI